MNRHTVQSAPVLNAWTILGPVVDLSSTTVDVTFCFEFTDSDEEHCVGAVFKACNDVLTLTITPRNAKVVNKDGVSYIDATITLNANEEYRVECGVKKMLWEDFKLYVRIWERDTWQEEEQQP